MRVARKFIWLNAARLAVVALVLATLQILTPNGGANAIAGEPSNGFSFGTHAASPISFDPTKDGYIKMSTGFTGGAAFTVEGWVHSQNYGIGENAVVMLGANDGQTTRALTVRSLSATRWSVDLSSTTRLNFTFSAALANNSWNYVAVSQDATNGMRMWINGAKAASVECGSTCTDYDATGNKSFNVTIDGASYLIGSWSSNAWDSLGGTVSSLRLSNEAVYSPASNTMTVPSGPLTALATTKLLLNNPVSGSTPVDSSSLAQTLTSYGIVNYADLTPNYTVTFNKQNNSATSDSVVRSGSYATATDPTWYGYNFKGWAETSTGVVRNLSAVAITGAKTFYAIWEQKSIAGLTSAQLGTPDIIVPNATLDKSATAGFGNTSSLVKVPAGSLPDTYQVKVYTLADNDIAEQNIGANNTYIISQVVAWSDTANGSVGNIQDTAAGKPIEMTITSPDIKTGAKVYSLLGNVSTLLATATQDGSVTATFSVDPVIVVQAAPVVISSGGGYSAPVVSPTPTATTPPVKTLARSFNVLGFNPGSWTLTKSIKKSIDSFFKSINKPSKISCVGYTTGPTILRVDYNLAMRRGQEVCKYIVAKNPSIAKMTTKGTTTKISDGKYRRTTINWTE